MPKDKVLASGGEGVQTLQNGKIEWITRSLASRNVVTGKSFIFLR
jgi:hypothetical protein